MKKIILVLFIISIVGFFVYHFTRKKTDRTGDALNPDIKTPPIVAQPPKSENEQGLMSPFDGPGKFAVDQTIARMEQNGNEVNDVLLAAGINQERIYNGTDNKLWKDRILGNGVILPLYISGEKSEILTRGKNIVFQNSIWSNVSNIRSVSGDFAAKTGVSFLTSEAQKDSNKFVDEYPCNLQGCPSNDKKRNDQVMKNGTMQTVTENFKLLCSNYLDAVNDAKTAVRNEAVKKLVNAGWKFPGY